MEGGIIFGYNGELNVDDLFYNFTSDRCKSKGKPKLFFIQACRGSLNDPGIVLKVPSRLVRRSAALMGMAVESLPVDPTADFLIMNSTSEGFHSYRNMLEGSWFIQALCVELRENIHEDLMTIVTGVNRRVAFAYQSQISCNPSLDASKQMPNIKSTLTKKMFIEKKLLKTSVKVSNRKDEN
jgi:hypothetical protein